MNHRLITLKNLAYELKNSGEQTKPWTTSLIFFFFYVAVLPKMTLKGSYLYSRLYFQRELQ